MLNISKLKELKDLRKDINNEKVSLLVGSGFSKNANKKFPNWNELLEELVLNLYKENIDFKFYNLADNVIDKNIFYKDEINKIIGSNDQLELVSEYIKKKGYRESITKYIENKFDPIINSSETKYDFSLHKKLLSIPWNNVYTTNYDNLLIKAIDTTIKKNEDKRKENKDELKDLRAESLKLSSKKEELEDKLNKGKFDFDDNLVKNNIHKSYGYQSKDELNSIKKKIRRIKMKKRVLKKNQIKVENELDKLQKEINEINEYIRVISSKELSVNNKKRIIKLHGSFNYKEDENNFEFDGDKTKKYVISKEDYLEYPKKHEAFTQLMRISLLQESFCLIGFSGDDPNFKGWISWVRDIIDSEIGDNKIYLIDINNDKVDDYINLFYENHNIIRIPLKSKEIKSKLMEYVNVDQNANNEIKNLFNGLFCFLNDDIVKKKQDKYIDDFVDFLKNIFEKTNNDNKISKQLLDDIINKYKKIRNIVELSWVTNRTSIIKCKRILNKFNKLFEVADKQQGIILLGLLDLLLNKGLERFSNLFNERDSQVYIDFFNDLDYENLNEEQKYYYRCFCFIMMRNFNIVNNEEDFNIWREEIDEVKDDLNNIDKFINEEHRYKYEICLSFAFKLKLKELKENIENWKVEINTDQDQDINWRIKKAGLYSFFDSDKSTELISDIKGYDETINNDIYDFNDSSQFLYFQAERYFRLLYSFGDNKGHSEEINRLKKNNNDTIKEIIDFLLNIERDYDLKTYDRKRRLIKTQKNMISFNNNKINNLLLLFIESGIPPSVNMLNIISKETWYDIAKHKYKDLPEVILFYTLFYKGSDLREELIRVIIQEYIYCDDLEEKIVNIFNNYLNYVLENESATDYLLISEMFKAINPEEWMSFIEILWGKNKNKNIFYPDSSVFSYYNFMRNIISNINKEELIIDMILEFIVLVNKDNIVKIDYLIFIMNNNYVKKNIKKIKENEKVKLEIRNTINRIKDDPINNIKILNNIYDLLLDNHKKAIKDELLNLSKDILVKLIPELWQSLIIFSNEDFRDKLKEELIKLDNNEIWPINLENKDDIFQPLARKPIPIISTFSNITENGIEFNDEEAGIIFDKIRSFMSKNNDFDVICDFEDTLYLSSNFREMFYFLDEEKNSIKTLEEFSEVYNKINNLYIKTRGFQTIQQGLLSNNDFVIINAFRELRYEFSLGRINQNQKNWETLLWKLINYNEPKLEYSLGFMVFWLESFKDTEFIREFIDEYKLILFNFIYKRGVLLSNKDQIFIQKQITKLALVVQELDVDEEFINQYIDRMKSSRFNEIRNLF